ncbi:MAG: hypothetical protein KBT02_07355 [Treponema sp.]|nr:hypothetical protein [Candidatus Treponema caballi]
MCLFANGKMIGSAFAATEKVRFAQTTAHTVKAKTNVIADFSRKEDIPNAENKEERRKQYDT